MKHITKHILSVLTVVVLTSAMALAQQTFPPRLEKISLQTDRSLYLTGESLWFTAFYQLNAGASIPLSKVLYVELFNNQLEVVASQKLEILQEVVSGKIEIPDQLKTGYYLLRAYTGYQQNFPVWEMETRVVSIINPNHPLSGYPLLDLNNQIELTNTAQGDLAFRIHEPLNRQTDSILLYVNGIQTDSNITYHENGLGKIYLEPKENDRIQLRVIIPRGDTIESKVLKTDVRQMHIDMETDKDQLYLMLSRRNRQNENLVIDVYNLTNGTHIRRSTFIADGMTRERFPLNETGSGLLQIRVTDLNNNELSSLYYYAPSSGNNPNTSGDRLVVESGSTIQFNLPEPSGTRPLQLSFVLSGTTELFTENLPNYLINNPLYLDGFVSQKPFLSEKIKSQIDIVLDLQQNQLIKQLTTGDLPFVVPEIYGINLKGQLLDASTKEPLENELVYCTVLGADPQFHATHTNRDGRFIFPLNRLENRQSIFVGTAKENTEAPTILIHSGYCTAPPVWNSTSFVPDTNYRQLIKQMLLNQQVSDAFRVCQTDSLPLDMPFRPIFGHQATTIKLTDFVQLSTTQEVFNELVPFVKARKKDGHFKLVVLDEILNMEYDDPLVMVDQVPYNNIDEIMKLQPTEIEKIEVISRIYAHGNTLFNGIIVITTGAGNLAGMPIPPGSVFVEYNNFNSPVQFSPTSDLPQNANKPNFTNTVFWKVIQQPQIEQVNLVTPNTIADYDLIVKDLKNGWVIKHERAELKKSPEGK